MKLRISEDVNLTYLEIDLMLLALKDLRNDGVYWGRKAYFYKRRDTLIEKLEQVMKRVA